MGKYVLYWSVSTRRLSHNFALDHALAHCRSLGLPLVIFEALRVGYRWANDRNHLFVLEGMKEHRDQLAKRGVTYFPYVESEPGEGKGLLDALASEAAIVVSDDFPCFFVPRMQAKAALLLRRRGIPFDVVDSNGLYPIRHAGRSFSRAHDFRRHLHRTIRPFLSERPAAEPFSAYDLGAGVLPGQVRDRWPPADLDALVAPGGLAALPIDHSVESAAFRGGASNARRRLSEFLETDLSRYGAGRNHPDDEAASGLSPYLHFGHLSVHEVLTALENRLDWSPAQVDPSANGARAGFWNMGESADSFLDELVTWRELGYGFCAHRPDYAQYSSLPTWARETLESHADDAREYVYDLRAFEESRTHDEIWNAAQTQLRTEGRMHNYLRMLWGKKILHWSEHPRAALDIMVELNNKYAVDGRDPNSYSGIFWTLGRFDRAWGPERPIFGKIRYMTSDSTRRKLRLDRYLSRFGAQRSLPTD